LGGGGRVSGGDCKAFRRVLGKHKRNRWDRICIVMAPAFSWEKRGRFKSQGICTSHCGTPQTASHYLAVLMGCGIRAGIKISPRDYGKGKKRANKGPGMWADQNGGFQMAMFSSVSTNKKRGNEQTLDSKQGPLRFLKARCEEESNRGGTEQRGTRR